MGFDLSWLERAVSRRRLLGAGLAAGGAVLSPGLGTARAQTLPGARICRSGDHAGNGTVGTVDHGRNGFDPHAILTDWDTGTVSARADGRRVREYRIVAVDREIEIAPGLFFPAWTYNGRVPGPTIRATEGDIVRIEFLNSGTHPHTMHFHGIHGASMDGIPGAGQVDPGESFTYEFTARPFGCHLYHCHTLPLKRHLHKGLYGAFIVDPDPARHPDDAEAARGRLLGTQENARWQEMVMVMNGFDTNFDEENEVYGVNSIAFAYHDQPIRVARDRPVRVYLVNVTEFDPVNSFHLHANFFDYFDHGTTLTPTHRTVDTIMQCQAQRGILEFTFAEHEPGLYMFHAHQAEFVELGWMGFFEVAS
ncbi:MAG: multicopper oxidase domain-containing protein [Hyphomicrobiales bacterium]|nr:multicopper oxidase domain-containing protein [Hyphomicrobiales bacterium]